MDFERPGRGARIASMAIEPSLSEIFGPVSKEKEPQPEQITRSGKDLHCWLKLMLTRKAMAIII